MTQHWSEVDLKKDDFQMEKLEHVGSTEALTPVKRRQGFWARRSGLEKALLSVLGVCGFAMVAGGSYFAINNSNGNVNADNNIPVEQVRKVRSAPSVAQSDKQEVEVCTTPECVLSAGRILSSVDLTANPCEDFFQFSCGQWIADNPIPDSDSRWGSFDALRADVRRIVRKLIEAPISEDDATSVVHLKNMNQACNDLESIEAAGYDLLLEIAGVMGGWPMIQTIYVPDEFNPETAAGLSRRFLGQGAIVNLYVDIDDFDANVNVIKIDQADLSLSRDFYLEPETYSKYLEAYKNYITEVALVLTREAGEFVAEGSIRNSVDKVLEFETKLAQISVPDEDRRNTTEMYNPMTVAELTEAFPLDWIAFLTHVFGDTDVEIDETERVIVIEPEFLHGLVGVLQSTSLETIADYLFWSNLKSVVSHGPQELRDITFKFSSTLSGVTQQQPRWSTCVNAASSDGSGFGFAVAHEYIKENFDEVAKQEATELVDNLRIAFKELVDESVWMDEETQEKAKEKADLITQLLGYPDFIVENESLDEFYAGVRPTENNTHLSNVIGVTDFLIKKDLETLRKPADHAAWFINPSVVNAFYSPNRNSITFPAGILHPPFFRKGNPRYLNYGAIGVVIGHEITHGFDDQGRQYDGNGNAFPWWSDATIGAFGEQAQCFVDMYTNYTLPELIPLVGEEKAHINGVNTQGENIADNGGVREAFRAYKKSVEQLGPELRLPGLVQFTPEQLFFIGHAQVWCQSITDTALLNQVLADPHSPAKYRVFGPMSNSEDFVEQFQCKEGSPMNRADKCLLW